jgi:hypothetical protein
MGDFSTQWAILACNGNIYTFDLLTITCFLLGPVFILNHGTVEANHATKVYLAC